MQQGKLMAVLLCLSCMQRHKELEEEKKRVGVYALHFPYACRPASPASPPLLLQLRTGLPCRVDAHIFLFLMHFAKLCEAAMFQFTSRLQALGQPCLAAVTTGSSPLFSNVQYLSICYAHLCKQCSCPRKPMRRQRKCMRTLWNPSRAMKGPRMAV